jgi:hypothetical protein
VRRLCLEVCSRFFVSGCGVLVFVCVHLSYAFACDFYPFFSACRLVISCSDKTSPSHRCWRTSYRRSFHRRSGETRRLEEGRVDFSTINSILTSFRTQVPYISYILIEGEWVVAVATLSYIFVFNLDFIFGPKLCCVSVHDRRVGIRRKVQRAPVFILRSLARELTKTAVNADALSMGFYS